MFVFILVIGFIPCVLVKLFMLDIYETQLISDQKEKMKYTAQNLSSQMGSNEFLEGNIDETMLTEVNQLADIYTGRVFVVDENYQVILDTASLYEGRTCISDEVFRCMTGNSSLIEEATSDYMSFTMPITLTEGGGSVQTVGVLVFSASTQSLLDLVNVMNEKANVVLLLVFVLLDAGAYVLSGYFANPYKRLIHQMDDLEIGDLNMVLDYQGFDITRKIADTVNSIVRRLRAQDESRQQFVSNVSHELKTPITSCKVMAESLVGQENVPVEIYQDFFESILEEVDREQQIVTDLLELVRMDDKQAALNVSQVNVNTMLEVILRRMKPIAQKRGIALVLEMMRPVTALVDETKLTLAVNNLVDNAVKYNKDNGKVVVHLDADHKYFYLTVEDTGVGIPEDAREHIFERFYRVDKARSRDTGGTGLGLAIAKSIITMHHGIIRLESVLGEGTKFMIRIPIRYTT